MWIPPIGVRRVVLDPLIFFLAVLSVVLSPLLFAFAALADLITKGSGKFVRTTRLFVVFMACEAVGLTAAFGLWVASGFGARIRSARFRLAHYRLLSWWLGVMSREIQVAFGFTLEVPDQPRIEGPVIVFSRHAGPGDSVFIAGVLLHDFDRFPRIVGKKELEFSPFFDVLGHRLPMRFIRPHPKQRQIALDAVIDAASNLQEHDAFVLFPEGGNFTPGRRTRIIESFERRGLTEDAAFARSLLNVLPPHPAGPLAAMEETPGADVVFVAHTGTEDLISPAIIWSGIPFGRAIRANYWHVDAAEVPTTSEERMAWLNTQWRAIDEWISANRVTAIDRGPASR